MIRSFISCFCTVFLEENLSLEPSIEDLKGDLKELFEEYNDLYHSFQQKAHKQDEYSQVSSVSFSL